jgi:hypothetical protein
MKRLTLLALAAACSLLLVGPVGTADAAKPKPLRAIASSLPVTGEAIDGVGTFQGRFKIREFGTQNGSLVAVGRLTGVLDRGAGNTQTVRQGGVVMPVQVSPGNGSNPVAAQISTCRILTLTLGPLDLNLLGLRIQLNRINLRITGQRGPGNLLGNLLCGLAGLLDPPTLARAGRF